MHSKKIHKFKWRSGRYLYIFFFQAEDGIRDFCLSRGLGDVYKRQVLGTESNIQETKLVISENPSRINFDEMDNKILADFSLVKFKAFLEQYQIQVDLLSGGLKHKDIVMIRLTNDNKVVLEGFYCKEYYQIRHLLYEYTMALKV
eukprot:TRINITY_DN10434_c0_g1_i2.p1 TRINITY_DN10434_c0_g1~~TRINITY_DN10434_c0_g1_i2.p1  ORF type:complete len:145 (+),score=29.33 TRINITY_DN10434_c0_g1_i2:23-457(+)